MSVAGPVCSYFLHRWGPQNAMRIGSIVMTAGLYVSAFTPSLEIMFFTYGIILGEAEFFFLYVGGCYHVRCVFLPVVIFVLYYTGPDLHSFGSVFVFIYIDIFFPQHVEWILFTLDRSAPWTCISTSTKMWPLPSPWWGLAWGPSWWWVMSRQEEVIHAPWP